MLRRLSTLVGVSFVMVVGAFSNLSASAFETINIKESDEDVDFNQSSHEHWPDPSTKASLASSTPINAEEATTDKHEASLTPSNQVESALPTQENGSGLSQIIPIPAVKPQPDMEQEGDYSGRKTPPIRPREPEVRQHTDAIASPSQPLTPKPVSTTRETRYGFATGIQFNPYPTVLLESLTTTTLELLWNIIPGDSTQQGGTYLSQMLVPLPHPFSPFTTDVEIPVGYAEISPGIYVPQHYLRPSPRITRPGQNSRVIDEQSSLLSAYPTPLPDSSSALTGMWEYPLYPLPTPVPVTSSYGWRIHPIHGTRRFHGGTDLAAPSGTPVLASTTGWVEYAGWMDGYGYTVILRHESGQARTLYAHLSALEVSVHQAVVQGDVIAQTGSTGLSTGPHLHFEIQQWDEREGGWVAMDSTPIVAYARYRLETNASAIASVWNSGSLADMAMFLEVRVALEEDVPSIIVGSSTTAVITSLEGESLSVVPPGLHTLYSNQTFTLSGQPLPSAFFLTPTSGGYVLVGNRWYRGKLLIAQRSTGLVVVNWVPIEDYLISVVGSEAYPNWDQAALEAQAIAARSYALAQIYRHRDDLWYEVSNTPRHQVYGGVEREFASTHQAVLRTQGIILIPASTFSEPNRVVGGVIEAQYASTQAISNSHHNGFGLSQWGAAQMASEGHDYSTILSRYYPDTHLTRLW